jgi:DNA topoisomerase I
MNLVIVESPTKAKTISRFLGTDYKVLSSYGHIRDLPKSKLGIDEEKDFSPEYIIPVKAKKTVSELKKAAKDADTIILATDEDREGEAIAWHIFYALGLNKSTNTKKIERIVFHEITKEAILEALKNSREIDLKMVDAQQARRVLDRLVGYKLSPFLWKKIARGLSAGRVQSVAVRLICEKEDEINKFIKDEYWSIEAELHKSDTKKESFIASLNKIDKKRVSKLDIKNEKDAGGIKKDLEAAKYSIAKIETKKVIKNPLPPYITSSLQQDAAIRLHFSSKKTMFVAQKLYEGIKLGKGDAVGLITYMRTDSTNLATSFLSEVEKYLKSKVGNKYFNGFRKFTKKSKGSQEAHEAIRPTSALRTPEDMNSHLTPEQSRLYELIWTRAIASQMTPAEFENTKVTINAQSKKEYTLQTKGEIQKFDGYLKIYQIKSKEKLLPVLQENDALDLEKVISEQKFTQPPKRYSEAMLIKTLEKYGIGRPSTYAPTISTIQLRGYTKKNEDRRFEPTEVGSIVNEMLVKHFNDIVDYEFTAKMEQNLDDIAEGEKEWKPIIKDFYVPFSETLEKAYKKVIDKSEKKLTEKKCPKCEQFLAEKFSRFGKFYACSGYPECKYTETPDGESNEPKYTGKKCPDCKGRMVAKKGRFGDFYGCENYPKCKHIESGASQKTGVACDKCSKGEIIQKRTKRGRTFYACDQYPECKNALWSKPTGEKCPDCGVLMVMDIKEKVFCSNKKLCTKEKE